MKYTKAKLTAMLKKDMYAVTFNKVNGTKRTMTCTLKPTLLPERTDTESTGRAPVRGVLPVWEVELKEWRSFRVNSVTKVAKL